MCADTCLCVEIELIENDDVHCTCRIHMHTSTLFCVAFTVHGLNILLMKWDCTRLVLFSKSGTGP